MAPKPKSPDFERPADFDVKAYAQRSPWTFATEPPEEVQLALSARGRRGRATRTSARPRSSASRRRPHADHVRLRQPEFAASRVLAAKGAIQVARGERLRARIADELAAIAERYEEGSTDARRRRSGCAGCCTSCRTSRSTPRACRSRRSRSMLGADREELLADLDLLSQVGPPDGDPGEYLLVSVDEGRVFVDLAHRLTRPLRLTAGRGLLAAARHPRAARERRSRRSTTRCSRPRRSCSPRWAATRARPRASPPATVVAEPDAAVATHLRTLVTAAPQARARRDRLRRGLARTRPSAARSIPTASSTTPASGTWSATATSAATCARSASTGSRRCAPLGERFERPADFDLEAYRRERLYVPSRRRGHRAGPARSARGHAHRRQLAGRRGHDARRRLGRAARRLRRLRVGHPAGCSSSAATPGSKARPRRARRCERASPGCAASCPRPRTEELARRGPVSRRDDPPANVGNREPAARRSARTPCR